MKINNFRPIFHNTICFKGKDKSSSPFRLRQLKTDVFERTTSLINKNKKVQEDSAEIEIKKTYDEVFSKICSHIPVVKKLRITKPKLVFRENPKATAAYNFPSNTIEIDPAYKEDLYAYQIFDKDGNLIDCGISFKNKIKKSFSKDKKINCKMIKLNPDEKKLYLKSILAHELRHWAQDHILASTKGCQEPYNYRINLINSLLSAIEELIEIAKANKSLNQNLKQYQTMLDESRKNNAYILGYAPKEFLDEDFMLETSILPYETKYWSIKDHFLPAALRYSNSDEKEYSSNPLEIDAYYFQAEFMSDEKDSKADIREDIFLAMMCNSIEKGFEAIEKIEEFGYPPLLED